VSENDTNERQKTTPNDHVHPGGVAARSTAAKAAIESISQLFVLL
jgi:hypothetical protein